MGIGTSKGVLRIQDRCHGNSTAKDANPCDLAQTRAWVEDYKRWVAGLPAVGDQAQPPDLQALVAHAGGYERITAEQWTEYDRAMARWQAARRPKDRRSEVTNASVANVVDARSADREDRSRNVAGRQ